MPMLVPTSFALAYRVELAAADELMRIAGQRLYNGVCRPNQWLFDDRVKSDESALSKLLLGPVPSLAEMQDMYAATIVVPTRGELDAATRAVQASLPDSRVVRRRLGDPATFVYDDVHIIARLGTAATGLSPGLREREFEVQIRTGLQYAWWRATHKVIYKGGRTWPLVRTASQVRASLELLDTVLANLRETARLQQVEADPADAELERLACWLERWDEGRRPADAPRFATAASDLMSAAGTTADEVERLLAEERGADLIADEHIAPLQAVLALLVEAHGAALAEALPRRRYVLVTEELIRVSPATRGIAQARRATLNTTGT
jgi:ppGpp synthetase/RelA/SpoT-type nucleotidyltranferase